ncbi:GntR family transcriptional regulator [Clostridium scatologenes]|uniref:Transcriptional regulator, GntR family n=1 Tax=Clostridium scatologenes TaxID=1548 RepID=A0A0E3GSI8_CLOSL|nr:GntR family transcriptional regulator [Clostridium scatologenes]AKA72146.1 transcriptional regulator, GntR family [Clostridium scatologenes]
MRTLVKQSLVDQIYIQIRDDIIEQVIPWGKRLNVNELQDKFGISSTPIREALNRLQKEGLIEYKNNIGANVISIEEKDIIEIQEVALTLDCAAIRYSMEKGKINEMAEELLYNIKCFQESDDEIKRAESIEQFSRVFYRYAENSRLIDMSKLIKGQQSMLRSAYRKEKEGSTSIENHIKIYNSVLKKDVDSAIAFMEQEYKEATGILLNYLK